jgi:protease-4
MRKFFARIFAVIGFLVVLLVAGGIGAWLVLRPEKPEVPASTVLQLDLERGIVEYNGGDTLLGYARGAQPSLLEIVRTLGRAGDDKRVKGLIAKVGTPGSLGYGQVQELRDAVRAFRDQGKFAIAYAESFGEFGPGTKAFYLAAAFDEIWLQPSGSVGLTGLIAEVPFVRRTLEDFELSPQLGRRHEYKTAMNFATETGFTEAHRASAQGLIDSLFAQVVDGIAAGRDLDRQQVRSLVDGGPYLGQEAVDAGLVDGLAYRDEVFDRAKEKAGAADAEEASVLKLAAYARRLDAVESEHKIALIYGVGLLRRGESEIGKLFGGAFMGSETVAKALRDAVEDDEVKAILMRIDSRGGSYVASDTIWREVARARQADKPVIVSMGNIAASGGYFVALPAEAIVAEPGTITGSIGVVAGKLATDRFWQRWGVDWDSVQVGANAAMWSFTRPYSDRGQSRLEDFLDRIYADFAAKVKDGRGLPPDKIPAVARGRVWTGKEAKALGLVDELGGLTRAIDLAKRAGGIPAEAEVELRLFPKPKSPLDRLLARFYGAPEALDTTTLAELVPIVERLRPLVDEIVLLSGETDAVLRMPYLELR